MAGPRAKAADPTWVQRFTAAIDPKWLAAVLMGLIGVIGSLKANHEVQETQEVVEEAGQAIYDYELVVDSLKVKSALLAARVNKLEKEVRTLKAAKPVARVTKVYRAASKPKKRASNWLSRLFS